MEVGNPPRQQLADHLSPAASPVFFCARKITSVSSYYWEDKVKTVKIVIEFASNDLEQSAVEPRAVKVVHNEDTNSLTVDLKTKTGASKGKALRLGPLKLAKEIKTDEAPRVKVTAKRVIVRLPKLNVDDKWYDLVKK